MPGLKADAIHARTVAPLVEREPAAGEVLVSCQCGWSTIRPSYAAPSARLAHQMAHDKGWV